MSAEPVEIQFENAERQHEAAKLGMWVFLSTEVMFFSALIASYTYFRVEYPEAFHQCSAHMERWVATFETATLLTSSLFVVLGLHAAKERKRLLCMSLLGIGALGGAAFLVMHGHEYWQDAIEGALPGRFYTLKEISAPGAPMFYAVYFFTTGLHSLHVVAGMALLIWGMFRARRLDNRDVTAIEVIGLYWHFVDMVWVFLYPLFYLVS